MDISTWSIDKEEKMTLRIGLQQAYHEDLHLKDWCHCLFLSVFFTLLGQQYILQLHLCRASKDFWHSLKTLWLLVTTHQLVTQMFLIGWHLSKTNNHLEGWHSKTRQAIGKPRPNVYELVKIFKSEQAENCCWPISCWTIASLISEAEKKHESPSWREDLEKQINLQGLLVIQSCCWLKVVVSITLFFACSWKNSCWCC